MSTYVYDVGDGVRAIATFKNLSGVVADPPAVTFQLKDPAGTITTPAVTQASTGVYRADFTLSTEGFWYLRFVGTGAVIAAYEQKIKVRPSEF